MKAILSVKETTGSEIEMKEVSGRVTVIQMKQAASRTARSLLWCALLGATVTVFVACQPNGASNPPGAPPQSPAQQSTAEGPGGTGGGNVVLEKSSIADVEATVDREFAFLPNLFTGWAIMLNPFYTLSEGATPTEMSDFSRLFATTPEAARIAQIAAEILAGGITRKDGAPFTLARIESILPLVKLEKHRDLPCDDTVKNHHDGSAHQMTICVSLQRLTRIPQSALKNEVSALLAHEFMHVLNYSEADAQLMQRYVLFVNTNSKFSTAVKIVRQFGYESGYAKFLIEHPEVSDPKAIMHGYFDWTRDAHLNFAEQISPLLENDALKATWLPRITAKRDRMQRIATELVQLAPVGADPENKKHALYLELAAEWVDAQKLAMEIAAINLNQAAPKLEEK